MLGYSVLIPEYFLVAYVSHGESITERKVDERREGEISRRERVGSDSELQGAKKDFRRKNIS